MFQCTSEVKTCVQTEGSDKMECMKKFKECITAKVSKKKEEAKKKYECVKKVGLIILHEIFYYFLNYSKTI